MHVLVCICSNVRQFQEIIGMIQLCYHTNQCSCWPCFVNTEVFLCYKTEGGGGTFAFFDQENAPQTGHKTSKQLCLVTARIYQSHSLTAA